MMAGKQKPTHFLFTIFLILHACISIGLITAVVHYQLVNESRFKKLEAGNVDCKCPSVGTQSNKASKSFESIYGGENETKHKSKSTVPSLVKRTLGEELHYNQSKKKYVAHSKSTPEPDFINKTSANSTSQKVKQRETGFANKDSAFSSSEKSTAKQSKETSILENIRALKNLSKEELELFSCLDKLKVIIGNQITTGKPNQKNNQGCKLLQGPGDKSERGEKGEKGEKGAIGPRGCSAASFVPPVFHTSPQYLVVNEGNPAVLSCYATANPAAQITWYRNNIMIVGERENSSHRYIVSNRYLRSGKDFIRSQMCPSEIPHPVTQSTLVIKLSRSTDTGTYVCKARNIMGTYSYKIRILVQVYVRCDIIPSFSTVVQGNDVRLSCRASGVPTPIITWYRKDGGPMPHRYNRTGGDLQIFEIGKDEEGTFVCMATNVLGSMTTQANITVYEFPKIMSFLDKTTVINDSQVLVLPCNATGYPSPKIRWSKINDSLPEGRYVYDSQILKISDVNYEDQGEYVCTAYNTVGKAIKKTTVIIQVSPKIKKRPNLIEYGYRGKSKVLLIEVFAVPAAKITWTKHNKEIDHGEMERFQTSNGSLFIGNMKYTDAGRYQATARNIIGEVKASTFLAVRDAVPAAIRLIKVPATLSIINGRNLTETCNAVGIPTPEIVWSHNDSEITSAITLNLTLNILNIGSEHAGRYTCSATNEFGSEQLTFDVKIVPRWVRVQKSHSDYYSYNYRYTGDRSFGELKSYRYSRRSKYSNGLHQYWKLTSNAKIGIYFKNFSTELCCDKVRIYDGSSTAFPLLGEFSGNVLPPNITSSSNQLYVTFTTDDSKSDIGFLATYKSIE